MKTRRIILSILSIVLTAFTSFAHEKDVVEHTFPFLKRVCSVSDLNTSKTYAFIANDGTNIYAVCDSYKSNTLAAKQISSLTTMDEISAFTLKTKKTSKVTTYIIKGLKESYYLGSDVITNEGKDGFYILQAGDYYPESLTLNIDADTTKTIATSDKHDFFKLYGGYAHKNEKSDGYAQCLPAFIYEIDSSVSSIGTLGIATAEGYGTIYSDFSYIMPQGITGYAITEANADAGNLTLATLYGSGEVVPAGSALLVKGAIGNYPLYAPNEANTASAQLSKKQSTAVATNLLHGTTEDAQTEAPDDGHAYNFYKLYYLTPTDGSARQLGFFFGAENGGAFQNKGGHAYLAVEKSIASQLRGFCLPNGESTAIRSISLPAKTANSCGIYTLSGCKLSEEDAKHLPAGIYIINGVKTYIK